MAVERSLFRIVTKGLLLCGMLCVACIARAAPDVVAAPGAQPAPEMLAAPVAQAQAKDAETLAELLRGTTTLEAEFTQTLFNPWGRVLESSRGNLRMHRPHLRWETTAPFPQIITLDETRVRIYDPDLEQITQRFLEENSGDVPLALLSSDEIDIAAMFHVHASSADGTTRFLLTPRSPEALFEKIELDFAGAVLRAIQIFDHAGQRTMVEFSSYRPGAEVAVQDLVLDTPPGTEIVDG